LGHEIGLGTKRQKYFLSKVEACLFFSTSIEKSLFFFKFGFTDITLTWAPRKIGSVISW
jgi:hypothetical protein